MSTPYANAPVSKGIALVTIVASLASIGSKSAVNLNLRNPWRALIYQAAFGSTGELIVGLFLLFQMRHFERHWGSRRYGSFVAISGALSASLSLSALSLLKDNPSFRLSAIPGGPYPLIFASLVQYYFDIPVSMPVSVLGLPLSDKTVNYALALQLMLSGTPHSIVASAIGLAVGFAYRMEFLCMRKLALPSFVAHFCSNVFLPLLQSGGRRGQAGRGGGGGARGQRHAAPGTQGYRDTLLGGGGHERGGGGGRGGGGVEGAVQRPAVARAQPMDPEREREALASLAAMGFTDEARNRQLLAMCGGDVHRVIEQLLPQ